MNSLLFSKTQLELPTRTLLIGLVKLFTYIYKLNFLNFNKLVSSASTFFMRIGARLTTVQPMQLYNPLSPLYNLSLTVVKLDR